MKNKAASIRARLTNIARAENLAFQLIIIRYLHERLLYRLSVSGFIDNFILKGGALLYTFDGAKSRPTIDIDLLGKEIENDTEVIKTCFIEICNSPIGEDCVWFNADTITAEVITENQQYNGIRLFVEAGFDTVRQKLQIDIGFGDVVTPVPLKIEYPVLLAEMPIPQIKAYSSETVIAEKFQAMIELSTANSRMKDFYDVYKILKQGSYNFTNLHDAIFATFKNRNTAYIENHALFTEDFAKNSSRKQLWQSFLVRANLDKTILFEEVVSTIIETLKPAWEKIKNQS